MGWLSRAAVWTALVGGLLLSACGGGSSSGTAQIRLLNASPGYPSLDLAVNGTAVNTGITYGSAGSYAGVANTAQTNVITATGSTVALSTTTRTLAGNVNYTAVAYSSAGALKSALIQDNVAAATSGNASLLVMNLAADAGTVDVYLTADSAPLVGSAPVAASVNGGASIGYATVVAGTYRLRVTAAGSTTDLRLDVPGSVTLTSTEVATLILTPGSGGVLVNALLVVQQGSVTALNNTQSRARVVAAVSGNSLVYATVAGTVVLADPNTPTLGLPSPTIGDYTRVPAGSAAVTMTIAGAAVTVPSQTLAAGGDYTLLVWGSAGAPKFTLIADANQLPVTAGDANLRLINGINGLTSPLTLLSDFTVVASNVAAGQASAYADVVSNSSARIDVTSPLSPNPVYTLTGANLQAKGVYTVFMLGDAANPTAAVRRER